MRKWLVVAVIAAIPTMTRTNTLQQVEPRNGETQYISSGDLGEIACVPGGLTNCVSVPDVQAPDTRALDID